MTSTRYPTPSNARVTAVMRANRKTGTKPEVALRSELHRRGLRFRKNLRLTVGSTATWPDVVFPKARVAVFVDGCFWHRCPEHGGEPNANSWYWTEKLDRNVSRDHWVSDRLQADGWSVVRIWEHVPPTEAAESVEQLVTCAERRPAGESRG